MKAAPLITVVLVATAAGLNQAAAPTEGSATVSTGTSKLGRILVDSRGHTLYLFERDTPGHSTCSGTCASYRLPLLSRTTPTARHDAKQSLLGVIRRSDGTRQVTHAGHPLYRFVQDTRPGSTAGQDSHAFGAGWYVLSRSGTKIESDGS
jgi:predicted lipoprotein with Yx(FWY)xxD motif